MSALVKCVIWDLDGTLWKGTLPEGDQIQAFPEALDLIRRLDAAGIVQSIASKNHHDDASRALDAIGIVDAFAYPHISWSAKSVSIREIVGLLNIGADTVVFLDDSPFERAEVASGVPGVRCYSLAEFLSLDGAHQLIPREVTFDAARRPQAYREEAQRKAAEVAFAGTPSEFLESLGMVLTVRSATTEDLGRAAELTERTNQLNTTGHVFSAERLGDYLTSPNGHVLIAELVDRFGDYGRIGLCLINHDDDHWLIELLLTSCRVMGRNIGTALIATIAGLAATRGVSLRALYRPNERNRQMRITYTLLGFTVVDGTGETMVYEHRNPGQIRMPAYTSLDLSPALIVPRNAHDDILNGE